MLKGVYDFVTSGRGNVFAAQAIVTSPTIWSTAAGTGGPLLYNGSNLVNSVAVKGVTAYILAVTCGITTTSGVAGALGITGGATTAPTTTTAITSVMNLRFSTGAPASPLCTVYLKGTVGTAGTGFLPLFDVDTGAQTVDTLVNGLQHLGGIIEVGVGNFASLCGSATLTSAVMQLGLVWAEVPND